MIRSSLVPALLLVSLAACGGGAAYGGATVEPINAYRSYQDFDPAKDKVILAKADGVDASKTPVRILQEALPAGIEMHEGTFSVAAGYQHRLIGKYAFSPGKPSPKTELVARVKRLVVAAGGDAAIVAFILNDATNYDVAQGIEAMIVKLDPRAAGPVEAPASTPGKSL